MNNKIGKIELCATAGCGNKCCHFDQGNYIVLYPGELEGARRNGVSTAHLKITDHDYFGGQKAVCEASRAVSCDDGLKPLDCVTYPFFPAAPKRGRVTDFIRGKKCPLHSHEIQAHLTLVKKAWNEVLVRNPAAAAWLEKVELVGYTEPMRHACKNWRLLNTAFLVPRSTF